MEELQFDYLDVNKCLLISWVMLDEQFISLKLPKY